MQMATAAVTNTPEIKTRDQWLHLSVMMGTAVSGQTAQSEWLLSFLGKPVPQGRGSELPLAAWALAGTLSQAWQNEINKILKTTP